MTTDAMLLTSDELAIMLNVDPESIRYWRKRGTGPLYIRLGHRMIRYRPEDVQDWLDTLAQA